MTALSSILSVETSSARLKRAEAAAEEALLRAGQPYHRWAIVVQDSPAESKAKAWPREEVIRQALAAAEKPGKDPEEAANLRDLAKRIKARPREVAELIFFEEGGADLHFLTPSREP